MKVEIISREQYINENKQFFLYGTEAVYDSFSKGYDNVFRVTDGDDERYYSLEYLKEAVLEEHIRTKRLVEIKQAIRMYGNGR
ncbi:hypothetical protein D4A35_01880 [Paraclostridium bifermentans]|uniref:Uncharacterized protein n=1 Tax=Paraclostridium bifermentans TaxID=1490 RepID=A0A5P3XAK3_PARBF|nr:hypothetical protein [Paraclostridium bifermentans]QEZ67742.1 hypothetical protein D4A35_01880 [Paraclostridium bifermentans]